MAQKTTRYAHIVLVKGIPQYAFTSRWAAACWASKVHENNTLKPHEITIDRLRIVDAKDEPPKAIGLKM